MDAEALVDQGWAMVEARQPRQARDLFARACAADPENAEAWMMLGTLTAELGEPRDALEKLARALAIDAAYADPHLAMARIHAHLGDAALALRHARQAVELDPDYAEAQVFLACQTLVTGQPAEAEPAAREALRLSPDSPEATAALAGALRAQGRHLEALAAYQRLREIAPARTDALLETAEIHETLGAVAPALATCREALATGPRDPALLLRLGLAFLRLRAPDAAADCFRAAAAAAPGSFEACNELGNACLALGQVREAEAAFRRAIDLKPDLAAAHANLGIVLQLQGQHDASLVCYREAVRLDPRQAELHYRQAAGLEAVGHFDEALVACQRALALRPDYPEAVAGVAGILERKGELRAAFDLVAPHVIDPGADLKLVQIYAELAAKLAEDSQGIQALERRLRNRTGIYQRDIQQACAVLGRLHDKAGAHDQAFDYFREAARLRPNTFDMARHLDYTARLRQLFSREFLVTAPRSGVDSARPVFVVGMPRSGTTLAEQIFASHPQGFGAGEMTQISRISAGLREALGSAASYPDCLRAARPAVLEGFAREYLRALHDKDPKAVRVVDKMPHNFLHLGLINLLFPAAHVIHMRREPRDTCLSCYTQDFNSSHGYTTDLEALGTYYLDYDRLMRHWREVLDIPLLEVSYEELVADFETQARAMIEFAGLAWDDACLRFYEKKRNIATPSYDQVRQPIYDKSVNRWKRYATHLAPLDAVLRRGGL